VRLAIGSRGTANAFPCNVALATCIATRAEKRRPLPGDTIVPEPMFSVTHAITINAPIERVWPWLAQMGSGRAGWYSWDAIDNGAKPSALSIVPGLQAIARGDVMPAVPGAKDAFVVAAVNPPHDLVLTAPDGDGGEAVSWDHRSAAGRRAQELRCDQEQAAPDGGRVRPPGARSPPYTRIAATPLSVSTKNSGMRERPDGD